MSISERIEAQSSAYISTEVPEGMTLSEYRRHVRPPKDRSMIRRLAGFGIVR